MNFTTGRIRIYESIEIDESLWASAHCLQSISIDESDNIELGGFRILYREFAVAIHKRLRID